ncbi:MAG: GNAT family N-acetyltransferase [Planctomycetota bacterium]|nr:GNAT family N-acetyltransferase [Planctomycetota bacterium]
MHVPLESQDAPQQMSLCRLLAHTSGKDSERLFRALQERVDPWDYTALLIEDDRAVAGALILDRPGRAGTLLSSKPDRGRSDSSALVGQVIRAATDLFHAKKSPGVVLAMTSPDSNEDRGGLEAGGMTPFATMVFMVSPLRATAWDVTTPIGSNHSLHAAPNDRHALVALLDETYIDSVDCPELTSRRRTIDTLCGHLGTLAGPSNGWIVAEREGKLVGLAIVQKSQSDSPGQWDLSYLGVVPSARKSGIGRSLLVEAARITRAAGAKRLHLACDSRNTNARKLYASFGFHETERRVAWIDTMQR